MESTSTQVSEKPFDGRAAKEPSDGQLSSASVVDLKAGTVCHVSPLKAGYSFVVCLATQAMAQHPTQNKPGPTMARSIDAVTAVSFTTPNGDPSLVIHLAEPSAQVSIAALQVLIDKHFEAVKPPAPPVLQGPH